MWWIFRVLLSTLFLLSIVLSIPIAFDVGGRDAGLAYSLSLFLFYAVYSTLKLLTPAESTAPGLRRLVSAVLRVCQWLVVPVLLIWALDRFSVDAGSADWVARTIAHVTPSRASAAEGWHEWFFGQGGLLESVTLGGWDRTLSTLSPVFQLLEGFCSLLVIQAAGQITKWLVNRGRSDMWVIILLVISGSILASSVYFLWRIAQFPELSNRDAVLIGATMTSAFFLCVFCIGSGRGNPVEASLLFAYVVLCIYQIFTDYQPSSAQARAKAAAHEAQAQQPDFPPLPPIIMASYSTLIHMLSSLPEAVSSSFNFIYAAFQTITPSVIISLTYRIIVFYCATRIIPAVRESGARALTQEPSLEDSDTASKLLGFLSWFSPSILIAIYTSLLLQHFTVSTADGDDVGWTLRGGDAGGNTWRWINVAATMALYSVELYLGNDDDSGMTSHWKMD